jgi:hypothetical protein
MLVWYATKEKLRHPEMFADVGLEVLTKAQLSSRLGPKQIATIAIKRMEKDGTVAAFS